MPIFERIPLAVRLFGAALLVAASIAACGSVAPGSSQAATPAPAAATTAPEATGAPAAAAMTKLNLNDVNEEQLMSTIPNFPSRMVREFFEYRPYTSISQFRKEIGKYVSEEQVRAYEQYVYVPIDVDAADAATLQQIPGVDQGIAEQLIAARPYGSNDAFLAKLGGLTSQATAQAAAGYLAA
jgi:radical SAM superfamily enzyme with C-terminal helix-hairpin-helix motif